MSDRSINTVNTVINLIITQIPQEQNNIEFIYDLDKLSHNINYTAPELFHVRWCELNRKTS